MVTLYDAIDAYECLHDIRFEKKHKYASLTADGEPINAKPWHQSNEWNETVAIEQMNVVPWSKEDKNRVSGTVTRIYFEYRRPEALLSANLKTHDFFSSIQARYQLSYEIHRLKRSLSTLEDLNSHVVKLLRKGFTRQDTEMTFNKELVVASQRIGLLTLNQKTLDTAVADVLDTCLKLKPK